MKKRSLVFLIIAAALEIYIFKMPRAIMYSDYEWLTIILWAGVIFVPLPITIYQGIKNLVKPAWIATALALISPIINGMGSGYYHLQRETKELHEAGIWTMGQVNDKKFVEMSKRSDYWAIKSSYQIKGKTFETSWENIDSKSDYEKGDSIRILCLPNFPKIYRIEQDWIE